MPEHEVNRLQDDTIQDFGEQWVHYDNLDNEYYGEQELFEDILKPFLEKSDIKDKKVADIGSGSGRIVNMLMAAEPGQVFAVEPSDAMTVLKRNTEKFSDKITYLKVPGDELPENLDLDYVFSIGVIHHIPKPLDTLKAVRNSLKPNGKFIFWVYGHEGNELYLLVFGALRFITSKLPKPLLLAVTWAIFPFLWLYIKLCYVLPLPMRKYMKNVLSKINNKQLILNIYDQLNPAYAKYYKKQEVIDLLESAGFEDIETIHRHGYSWTAAGSRPAF